MVEQFDDARKSVAEQRSLVQQKKEEASQVEKQLQKTRSALPQVTQQSLRKAGAIFQGLKGRLRRGILEQTKSEISAREKAIKEYTGELGKYETEVLTPYEKEITKAEQQYLQEKSQFEAQQQAYATLSETLQRNYEKNIKAGMLGGIFGEELKKAKEGFEQAGLDSKEAEKIFTEQVVSSTQGTQYLYSKEGEYLGKEYLKTGKVTPSPKFTFEGKDSGGYSFSKIPSVDTFIGTTPELPRETKVKELPSITGLATGIGMVSAVPIESEKQKDLRLANISIKDDTTRDVRISGGDDRSIFGKLWSGITDFVGSGSDFEKDRQKAKETYSPQLGMFVSASVGTPEVSKSTLTIRPPTIEEREQIRVAQERGSFSQLPPIKFLAGGYEWQKKFEEGLGKKPNIETPEQYSRRVSQSSFKDLRGNLPAQLTKVFYSGGEQLTKVGGKVTGSNLTTEQVRLGGEIIGGVGLFTAFNPLISTGATGSITKQLNKNKFEALEKFFQDVRSGLVQETKGTGQVKYLEKIYDKYFKGTPQGKENFKKLVEELTARGDLKVEGLIDLASSTPKTSTAFDVIIDVQAPQMRNLNLITGSSVLNVQDTSGISSERMGQVNWVGIPERVTTKKTLGFGVIPNLKLKENERQQQKQLSILKTLKKEGTAQRVINIFKSSSAQKESSRQKTSQKQEQVFRQKEVTKQKETGKPKVLFPSLLKRLALKTEEEPELFEIFTKKFGKDVSVAKTLTKGEAVKILQSKLGTTLRASGFVTKGGVKLGFGELGITSPSLTRSKKESFRVVERKEKRLKKGTFEVPEIQAFKKRGKSRKNPFGL